MHDLHVRPPPFVPELRRRLALWAHEVEAAKVSEADASSMWEAATALPPAYAHAVIRWWFHGWATTRRSAGATEKCKLGCIDCDDSQLHYLGCTRLWSAVGSVSELAVADDVAYNARTLTRLRLLAPEARVHMWLHTKRLVVAADVYHKLRYGSSATPEELARAAAERWSGLRITPAPAS